MLEIEVGGSGRSGEGEFGIKVRDANGRGGVN